MVNFLKILLTKGFTFDGGGVIFICYNKIKGLEEFFISESIIGNVSKGKLNK